DNCPFFAYHISLGDILYAKRGDSGSPPVFEQIISKSGNRTLRIFFGIAFSEGNVTSAILEEIKKYGCGYERFSDRYFSINVPPAVNYDKVCEFLICKGIDWEDADR
ncbi:MAG TPA: DUF4265 domain-containing protein, partial [Roseiarcus sp.]|nr:DUF4265 domain-containing protein [Roseiarcus sp.]